MAIKNFTELRKSVTKLKPIRMSVAAAGNEQVIKGIALAQEIGIIKSPVLTGDRENINNIINKKKINLTDFEIRPAVNDLEAAKIAVKAVKNNEVQIIAKGKLETVHYLRSILDRENGIKKSNILNNLTLFAMDSYHKLIGVSDNAIIPQPSLEEKKAIIENTKPLWDALGIKKPKVAVLAAIEKINSKMKATIDGSCLTKMVDRGQISGFNVEGPLSYDTAMSLECAKRKNLKNTNVPGDPDLLVMPNIESANMVGKSYKLHGNAQSGGIVFGAEVPVVLNSRSDTAERRLDAIMIARAIVGKLNK